jgi:PAS domain-containing protein
MSAPPRQGGLRGWLTRTLGSTDAPPPLPRDPFQVLFDSSAEGLLLCSADGRVLAANAAACKVFAVDAGAVVGRPATDFVKPSGHDGGNPESRWPLGDGATVTQGQAASGRPIELHVTRLEGPDGHRIVHLQDRAEHLLTQQRLTQLANYDSLTGLPNRALFRDRLGQAMVRSRRSGEPMALLFLDLDRFKLVNDSLGHEVGDRLLQHMANTLTQCLRNADSVSHLNGD